MYLLPSCFLFITTAITLLCLLVCDLPPRLLSQSDIAIRNSSFPCDLDFHEQCASSEQYCFYIELDTTIAANQLLADEDVSKLFSDADDHVAVSRLGINFFLTTKPSEEGRVGRKILYIYVFCSLSVVFCQRSMASVSLWTISWLRDHGGGWWRSPSGGSTMAAAAMTKLLLRPRCA